MNRQDIRNGIWQFLQEKLRDSKETFGFSVIGNYLKIPPSNEIDGKLPRKIILEELNNLVNASILFRGNVDLDTFSPMQYTITEFGKECIEKGSIFPFDPDGYANAIKQHIANINPVVLTYLHEAVATFGRHLLLSSTITLGAASEKCILLLIDSFGNALSDTSRQASFRRSIEGASIYRAYKLFCDELEKRKKSIPSDLLRDFDPMVDGVFNFIRYNRNKAGHPTGTAVDRNALQANLQIFASYAERIFALILYLDTHKVA